MDSIQKEIDGMAKDLGFLVISIKNLFKNMESILEREDVEDFLYAFKHFHRLIGEIFATATVVKKFYANNNDLISKVDSLLIEVYELLEKVDDVEQKYLEILKGKYCMKSPYQ